MTKMAALSIVMRFSLYPQIFFSHFSLSSRNPLSFYPPRIAQVLTFINKILWKNSPLPNLCGLPQRFGIFLRPFGESQFFQRTPGRSLALNPSLISLRAYLFFWQKAEIQQFAFFMGCLKKVCLPEFLIFCGLPQKMTALVPRSNSLCFLFLA